MASVAAALEDARAKFNAHSWGEAFDLLSRCDRDSPLEADDLENLAEAAWWTSRLDDCLTARERAFELHCRNGDEARAAAVAILIAKDYFAKGKSSVGQAWFARASRMLEKLPDCVELGYLERTRSAMAYEGAGDYSAALEHAERANEIAMRFQDKDLIALSIFDKGRSLAASGQVDEGKALMDEATVAAISGELSPLTTGFVYCNMISTCEELADFRRAADWTEATHRWCERQSIAGFPGLCRVHRAGIIRLRGDYQQAADEAVRACEEIRTFHRSYAAEGFYELGRIRLEMGLSDEAEAAFRQAHEMGRDPQPGLALLHLRRGKPQAALSGLERAVEDEKRELFLARLLPALVEVRIANGDVEGAGEAAERLGRIADTYGTPALWADAHGARARVSLAQGDPTSAQSEARAAIKLWTELEIPYEIARTRVVLAEAYVGSGDHDGAGLERDAATTIFRTIGASSDLAPQIAPADVSGARAYVFRREGDYWTIEGEGTIRVRDSKGLRHLARLLQAPGSQIHVLDLVAAEEGTVPSQGTKAGGSESNVSFGFGDAGELLDPEAKAAYRRRLKDLQDEIDESEGWGDAERAARAREEMEALTEELGRAIGLGGRDRKAASAAERARVNVTRAIRGSLEKMSEHDEGLARSLDRAVRTGTFCTYEPGSSLEIKIVG